MSSTTDVKPPETGKKTSRIVDAMGATMQIEQENAQCHWNDQAFAKGGRISVDGKVYECSFGCWINTNPSAA